MSIQPVSPLAVVAVTDSGAGMGHSYEIETSIPHGISGSATVTIAGCRNTIGVLISGLNATVTAIEIDATHFYFTVSYVAGYDPGSGGSVWIHGSKVTAATLTGFDSSLAIRCTDKTGDVLFGNYGFALNGAVASVTITNGGSGYSSPPSVTFDAAPEGGDTTATGTAVLTAGVVTSVTINDAGAGYLTVPHITFGSGAAAATAVMGHYSLVVDGGQILTTAADATIGTSSSGNIVLGAGDDIQLLPPRTRSIMISPTEALNPWVDPKTSVQNTTIALSQMANAAFGVQQYYDPTATPAPQGFQTLWIPLTRLHDGATLVRATMYFFSPLQSGDTLPTRFPSLQVFRFSPTVNGVSGIGTTVQFSLSTASSSAYSYSVNVTPGTLTTPASVSYSTTSTSTVAGSVSAYANTPAIGASGFLTLATNNGGSATISANSILTDPSSNVFNVTTSGTYANGAQVPIQAIAPAAPATFYGANTNVAAGTVLTWASVPANCIATQLVSSSDGGFAGLTGGLNAGYAQSLVFVPDAANAVINQSEYIYTCVATTDNAPQTNSSAASPLSKACVITGIKFDFENITSLAPQ